MEKVVLFLLNLDEFKSTFATILNQNRWQPINFSWIKRSLWWNSNTTMDLWAWNIGDDLDKNCYQSKNVFFFANLFGHYN